MRPHPALATLARPVTRAFHLGSMGIRAAPLLPRLLLALTAFAPILPTAASEKSHDASVISAWVQVAPPRLGVVRAVVTGRRCPSVRFDGRPARMHARAEPNSDFDVLVCEREVPRGTRDIRVAGRALQPVPRRPQRIAVIGDTGCRMKAGSALDDGFQNCSNPDDWQFAKVARQVAAWQPDLIIQVGDYIYREQACPQGCGNCQGSPYDSPGMRMQTWEAEFFTPARPMLEAAPLVFVRGDHETCERAGSGYFRFLDPFRAEACEDFTDPYALEFQGLRLLVMDTVQAGDTALSPAVVIKRYARDFERAARLVKGPTWLLSHRPVWALRPAAAPGSKTETDVCGNQTLPPLVTQNLNVTVQDALAESALAGRLPPAVQLVVTGHIHVGEVLSFTGGRPPEMVVGNGGTKLLPAVTEGLVGTTIDGETVTAATMLSAHGFFGFTRTGDGGWQAEVITAEGSRLATCEVAGRLAICAGP